MNFSVEFISYRRLYVALLTLAVSGCSPEGEAEEDHPRLETPSVDPIFSKTVTPEPDLPSHDPESHGPPKVRPSSNSWWMSMPWEETVSLLAFDSEGTPSPIDVKPRITKKTRDTTREIHKQIAIHTSARGMAKKVGNRRSPKLAAFLSSRASIETSMQGNHRPFDMRGSVHGLDVKAAYRAGLRRRPKFVEAGNEIAEKRPEVFLGYGQAGMISWLFLDRWDIKGDPRMLGDSVIGGLTYRRALVESFNMLKGSKIRCSEYSDMGREKKLWFNGKKYKVGAPLIDESAYSSCISEGGKQSECRKSSRKTYRWKPGDPQPKNTVQVDKISWWTLKQAAGGRPCPPWKGDEYQKYARDRFRERSARFGLDSESEVRRSNLGDEPGDVNQYDLWRKIWDSSIESLGREPIDWSYWMPKDSKL